MTINRRQLEGPDSSSNGPFEGRFRHKDAKELPWRRVNLRAFEAAAGPLVWTGRLDETSGRVGLSRAGPGR